MRGMLQQVPEDAEEGALPQHHTQVVLTVSPSYVKSHMPSTFCLPEAACCLRTYQAVSSQSF